MSSIGIKLTFKGMRITKKRSIWTPIIFRYILILVWFSIILQSLVKFYGLVSVFLRCLLNNSKKIHLYVRPSKLYWYRHYSHSLNQEVSSNGHREFIKWSKHMWLWVSLYQGHEHVFVVFGIFSVFELKERKRVWFSKV